MKIILNVHVYECFDIFKEKVHSLSCRELEIKLDTTVIAVRYMRDRQRLATASLDLTES